MELPRPVGREAGSRKYDILTALAAHALAQEGHRVRLVLRLIALITARYNWQRDELAVGQVEIARLWSVDERTVKREMARLRAMGWLVQKRAAARGRVAVHGLDVARLLHDTRPAWPQVGEDFVARMAGPQAVPASNVVPLRPAAPPRQDGSLWAAVQAQLAEGDPAAYASWFRVLAEAGLDGGRMTLAAPTRFHATYVMTHLHMRLLAAVRAVDPSVAAVIVTG
jgi:hypothetical protein